MIFYRRTLLWIFEIKYISDIRFFIFYYWILGQMTNDTSKIRNATALMVVAAAVLSTVKISTKPNLEFGQLIKSWHQLALPLLSGALEKICWSIFFCRRQDNFRSVWVCAWSMNPYYANWSYGYTLQPSSEATRGAYGVQYGGHGAGGGGHHGHGQPPVPQHGASNWGQIKGRYREVCGV